MITISATLEMLIDEADQLLAQAEKEVTKSLSRSCQLVNQGVGKLLQAYLILNEKRPPVGLREQIELCLDLEPDFVSIEAELEYLSTANPEAINAEDLIDTANEVWDFLTDLLNQDQDFDDADPEELD